MQWSVIKCILFARLAKSDYSLVNSTSFANHFFQCYETSNDRSYFILANILKQDFHSPFSPQLKTLSKHETHASSLNKQRTTHQGQSAPKLAKNAYHPAYIDKISHVFDETIRHVRRTLIVIHKARSQLMKTKKSKYTCATFNTLSKPLINHIS